MKTFLPFIIKEFYHIFRDMKILLILFIMPIVLVILFGFAIRTDVKDANIAILDYSKDELSISLTDKLLSSGYFICESNLESAGQIDDEFKKGSIKLALIIPEDFSENFYRYGSSKIQIITDGTNINTSTVLRNYIESIVERFRQDKLNIISESQLIDVNLRMIYNPEMRDIFVFVPGILALVLMLVSAIMTAVSLSKEKESGTLKILTVSPLRTVHIIVGKVLPYLLIAICNTIIILLLSVVIFDMPIQGSMWSLMAVCLVFLTTALTLGIFISALSSTQLIAIVISIVALFLPTMMLSGFIYPVENMPYALQIVSNVFPATWFIIAIKAIMIKGSSITTIWFELSVMGCMSLFFVLASVFMYRKVKKG